jgi:hypothetical protein
MSSSFYTYAWLRVDGTPYYVGKGKGGRAYKSRGGRKCPGRDRVLILKKNLTEVEALRHEVYMIAVLGRKSNGGILTNLTDGGEGVSGYAHTEEAKVKIGKSQLGELNHNFGRPETSRHITGLSGEKSPNWGRDFSEEHKRNISESKKGEKNPMHGVKGENHHSSKPVKCLNTGKVYPSSTAASEETGANRMLIGKCCRGERKQTKGLNWEFA